MEWLILIYQVEYTRDQLFSFEIGQAAQVRAAKMSVFVRVAPGATKGAFPGDLKGKRWDSTSEGPAPGLQYRFDPYTHGLS
jgi:hypothetical protein